MTTAKLLKPVDTTQSAAGPKPMLVSGLPPELTKGEALTPGVFKLLRNDKEENDRKLTELEKDYKSLSENKTEIEKENIVLKTKLSYSVIWDVLITLAGICGGSVLVTWNSNKDISVLFGVLTVLLFSLAVFGRKK